MAACQSNYENLAPLIRASGQNSEDPGLSPGWISMLPATKKKNLQCENFLFP